MESDLILSTTEDQPAGRQALLFPSSHVPTASLWGSANLQSFQRAASKQHLVIRSRAGPALYQLLRAQGLSLTATEQRELGEATRSSEAEAGLCQSRMEPERGHQQLLWTQLVGMG